MTKDSGDSKGSVKPLGQFSAVSYEQYQLLMNDLQRTEEMLAHVSIKYEDATVQNELLARQIFQLKEQIDQYYIENRALREELDLMAEVVKEAYATFAPLEEKGG